MNQSRFFKTTLLLTTLVAFSHCSDDSESVATDSGTNPEPTTTGNPEPDESMSFFLTSVGPGDGANLGGLDGADAHCTTLAEAAGTSGQTWRAYLSTTGAGGVNAIDRIGSGPWINANGVTVATSTANLLAADENNITKETAITESGDIVNGRGDTPNRHDIITGTTNSGGPSDAAEDTTCNNWTSNDAGSALVGHHDREGGGSDPESWTNAHPSAGCSQADLISTAGDGLFYCFATN